MFPLTAETGRLLVETEEGHTRTINQLRSIFRFKNNQKDILKENSIVKNHTYFESPNSSVITTSTQSDDHSCEVIKIALLYANANQLCTLFVHKDKSWAYEISFFLLIVCIMLQVVMGMGVILKGQMNSRGRRAKWVDDYFVGTGIIITVINVLVATFIICFTPTSTEVEKPSG